MEGGFYRDRPRNRESQRERDMREYKAVIDQAWQLRNAHTGDNHIWQALNNYRITDRSTRNRLRKLMKSIFKEREPKPFKGSPFHKGEATRHESELYDPDGKYEDTEEISKPVE